MSRQNESEPPRVSSANDELARRRKIKATNEKRRATMAARRAKRAAWEKHERRRMSFGFECPKHWKGSYSSTAAFLIFRKLSLEELDANERRILWPLVFWHDVPGRGPANLASLARACGMPRRQANGLLRRLGYPTVRLVVDLSYVGPRDLAVNSELVTGDFFRSCAFRELAKERRRQVRNAVLKSER